MSTHPEKENMHWRRIMQASRVQTGLAKCHYLRLDSARSLNIVRKCPVDFSRATAGWR